MIRRELVFSTWYGRWRKKLLQFCYLLNSDSENKACKIFKDIIRHSTLEKFWLKWIFYRQTTLSSYKHFKESKHDLKKSIWSYFRAFHCSSRAYGFKISNLLLCSMQTVSHKVKTLIIHYIIFSSITLNISLSRVNV